MFLPLIYIIEAQQGNHKLKKCKIMYIYCLIHICSWFVTNNDRMHGKCRILRFKIIVFLVMGLCNLVSTEVLVRMYCLHLRACNDKTQTAPPQYS